MPRVRASRPRRATLCRGQVRHLLNTDGGRRSHWSHRAWNDGSGRTRSTLVDVAGLRSGMNYTGVRTIGGQALFFVFGPRDGGRSRRILR
jgi:hypothetical protein